jgi:hypothetical protein
MLDAPFAFDCKCFLGCDSHRGVLPPAAAYHRFNKIAARNWDRMKATANQAYSTAVKPLMDRLSGDQQQ